MSIQKACGADSCDWDSWENSLILPKYALSVSSARTLLQALGKQQSPLWGSSQFGGSVGTGQRGRNVKVVISAMKENKQD